MKKSYKGFPIYALIIIGVLIAAQLFSSSFSSQRGQRIEAAKLFEYIDSGVIDAVALEDDVAYAHMKASNIPLSAFSNSAYDFSAHLLDALGNLVARNQQLILQICIRFSLLIHAFVPPDFLIVVGPPSSGNRRRTG